MHEGEIHITVDGIKLATTPDVTVAAAMFNHGIGRFRTSITGEPRGPLCGMAICFECRVTIDGREHQRSCRIFCRDGMVIETHDQS